MSATIASLRAELRSDSRDVPTPRPRLSWTTATDVPDWTQAGAEVELDHREVVRLDGPESVLVPWPFAPLRPRERHTVRVRVTGADGATSDWSDPCELVAAFLAEGEWEAPMIGLPTASRRAQPALLRAEFDVTGPLVRATLYATAQGVYQVEVNGREVDDQVLKPGWTPYRRRLIHETTDVTGLVATGRNAIGVWLAGGWYTEEYGFSGVAASVYGEQPTVAVQLLLEYADGTTRTIITGDGWQAFGNGPIVESGIYHGEHYDARKERPGWSSPGFAGDGWLPARVLPGSWPVPSPRTAPAVRALQRVGVREVLSTPAGGTILDFGQNLVGRLRISVSGRAGTVVTLRHAEVLENGELGVRPLRDAKATDSYTLRGEGVETWTPRFTFHGFRYAQVTGLPGGIDPAGVEAVVLHSDLRRTGYFDSSHPLLNRLHENVVWGMRGNFLHLPTDCPQRDERLGWTGDIQVFSPTASFLYDTDGFLSSWLVDLAVEQAETGTGCVPFVVPNVLRDAATPAAAWGDAATVVPSVLHERYGDLGVLAVQYDSMRDWAEALLRLAGERLLWQGGFQFGDWLDPTAPADDPFQARTDPELVASAYLVRSVELTARAAASLGQWADATRYRDLAGQVRAAFVAEYVTASGRMVSDTQTAYALGIVFGLFATPAQRDRMGERLAALVEANDHRIGTGFVGTPLVADALTLTGHHQVAGRLLLQTANPSWLYPVTMGATTIWERWDSMLEDGSINPGEMTSFNHYALGAVADWLHRSVAGLAPAAPGYRVLRIAPHPIDGLDHASARLDTPYGEAVAGWRREGTGVVVDAVVPPNTTAEIHLPGGGVAFVVGSGSHQWAVGDAPA